MNIEKILKTNSLIVSETDEKGIITFANKEFCDYSGYSLKELVGRPHNIIRHPDMPRVAFKEMWSAIQKGLKWSGFVKNRSKDGSAYWVYAQVFPHITATGKKGYVSCRVKPSLEEIRKASALYKSLA